MNVRSFPLLFLFVMAVTTAPKLAAAPTEPGVYRKWDGEIDEVAVKRAFRADDFQDIQVEPLDIANVTVPERAGESRSATIAALPSLKPAFMDGMQKNLRQRAQGSAPAGRALLIRVHITKADPGTRSPKFGDVKGNAAKLAVRGEVIDRATNLTLIEFKQERWFGVISIGKSSAELLKEAARLIGEDVARLINAY